MMKRLVNLLAAFILSVNCISAQNLTRWVNPFIGTGAVQSSLSGNNYPGATVPFGMVQLSPDTREAPDWAQASGYDYNDSIIYGFSHTRLSGTGASDFIDILLFPTISDKRKSTFTHQHEQARPGYYQVLLKDEKIQAELEPPDYSITTPHGFSYRSRGISYYYGMGKAEKDLFSS